MEYIATFFTHYGAICFGRKLEKEGHKTKMMPVPRKLSSSCGTCVRFEGELTFEVQNDEDIEGLYRIDGDEYEVLLERE